MVPFAESSLTIVQTLSIFTDMRMEQWLQETLYTWQWWLLVALLIAPWILWWHVVDKKRFTEIVLLGMFVLATCSWMDEVGCEMILWYYPYKLLPVYPQLVPINYAVIPVTYMLIYQYFRPWRSYIVAMVINAALFSFVAEPSLNYLGMYKLVKWYYYYSFPIYIIIAVSHRWLVEIVLAINKKYNKESIL